MSAAAVSERTREALCNAVQSVEGVAMVVSPSPLRRVFHAENTCHPEWIQVSIDGVDARVAVSIALEDSHKAVTGARSAYDAVVTAWRAREEVGEALPHLAHVSIHVVAVISPRM